MRVKVYIWLARVVMSVCAVKMVLSMVYVERQDDLGWNEGIGYWEMQAW